MAVLRPDQAQLTFAAESAPGADVETGIFSAQGSGVSTFLKAGKHGKPGDRVITAIAAQNLIIGDFIGIGNVDLPANASAAITLGSKREIRRIEFIYAAGGVGNNDRELVLDRPLAFYHDAEAESAANNATAIIEVNGYAATDPAGRDGNVGLITWTPGVYEGVNAPDPQMAIEPRYFLGTQSKRDFFTAYKGQQTFNGSINGIVLLNGWPLRFPFGKVITSGGTLTGNTTTVAVANKVGDMFIQATDANGDASPAGPTLTTSMYISIHNTSTLGTVASNREIFRVMGLNADIIQLNAPLKYEHSTSDIIQQVSQASLFYHHIVETIDLDSLTWNLRVADSSETDANAFIRRYVGGKVGAASISAEEGGLVTMNWDNVVFMDMLHNQQAHSVTTTSHGVNGMSVYAAQNNVNDAAVNMPGFAIMHDITPDKIMNQLITADAGFSTDEPYYFSQGAVFFWGQEFARIRSFSLSVNNNEDPRYYVTRRHGRHRGPSEVREQRREYNMSCVLALPDSAAATAGDLDSATALFKELLLEGQYDTSNMQGFKAYLDFQKPSGDGIRIHLPGLDPTVADLALPSSFAEPTRTLSGKGNLQGCFIRSATHNIGGEAPLQVDAEILFRNMHIVIADKIPVYP